MACNKCSPDEFVADRTAAYKAALALMVDAKEKLSVEVTHDDLITLAYFLAGVLND